MKSKYSLVVILGYLLNLIACKDECKGIGSEYDLTLNELKYTSHYKNGDTLFFISNDNKKMIILLQIKEDLISKPCGGVAGLGGGPATSQKIIGYGRTYYFMKNGNNSLGNIRISKSSPNFKINYFAIGSNESEYYTEGVTGTFDTVISNLEFKKCIKVPYFLFKTYGYDHGFILLEQSFGLRAFKSKNETDTSTYILQSIKHNN